MGTLEYVLRLEGLALQIKKLEKAERAYYKMGDNEALHIVMKLRHEKLKERNNLVSDNIPF